MLNEILTNFFTGFAVGLDGFFQILPIYNQLSGIKEQIIACVFGLPVAIVSIIFLVSNIIKLVKRLFL